jgi:hypothetical protein
METIIKLIGDLLVFVCANNLKDFGLEAGNRIN